MNAKQMTMQDAANEFAAVVVKEVQIDGMRAYAYPVASLFPQSSISRRDGFIWTARSRRRNITPLVVQDLIAHNAYIPVYPDFLKSVAVQLEQLRLTGRIGQAETDGCLIVADNQAVYGGEK